MKKKYLYIFFLIFFLSFELRANDTSFVNELIYEHLESSCEYLVIVFLDVGSCVKCYIYPERLISEVLKKTNKKISIIGLINCNRDKEIINFKKETNWPYAIKADIKKIARKKIGCKPKTDICFMDNEGNITLELSIDADFNDNFIKASNLLKK